MSIKIEKCYAESQSKGWTKPRPTVRKTYQLDDRTGQLLETGEEDLHQLVQSGYATCLDYVVDRFLESGLSRDDLPVGEGMSDNQDFLLDALDISADYVDMMEEARQLYGLSADLTYSQVRDQLQKLLDQENKKINVPAPTQEKEVNNGKNQTSPQKDVKPSQESETVPEHVEIDA